MDSLSNVLANQCLVFATPGRTKAYPRHLGQTWAFNLEPYQTDCEWLSDPINDDRRCRNLFRGIAAQIKSA